MHTSIVRRKQKKEQYQAFEISVSQKCLNQYSVHCLSLKNILIFKETGTKLKQFEKRKVHVNDRVSPNYLVLVRKVTRDEVVFLRVPTFMSDRTLWSIFRMSSEIFRYYQNPTKNPGTLSIKMPHL